MKVCVHCGSVIKRKVHPNTKNPFCNSTCYGLWQAGKKFSEQGKPAREKKACSVAGCDKAHFGKGYCRPHYLSVLYSPPKKPTAHTRSAPHKCAHCGAEFIAHHESPKFCSIRCAAEHRKKAFILKKGYRKLLIPNHHRADGKGYVFEHIVIAESKLGRRLIEDEEVHHIDHNKQNNDPSNLAICENHSEHMKIHAMPS